MKKRIIMMIGMIYCIKTKMQKIILQLSSEHKDNYHECHWFYIFILLKIKMLLLDLVSTSSLILLSILIQGAYSLSSPLSIMPNYKYCQSGIIRKI